MEIGTGHSVQLPLTMSPAYFSTSPSRSLRLVLLAFKSAVAFSGLMRSNCVLVSMRNVSFQVVAVDEGARQIGGVQAHGINVRHDGLFPVADALERAAYRVQVARELAALLGVEPLDALVERVERDEQLAHALVWGLGLCHAMISLQ